MTDSRKQAPDANGITLREFIDIEFQHQTTLLDERAEHHASEHLIHITAHVQEHTATQTAIKVATDALDKRLESMDKEIGLKLDTLTKGQEATIVDRANTRGYMLGAAAIISVVVVAANFLIGFLAR